MDILALATSFLQSNGISLPEAVMFTCFGVSWPVSVVKTLKTKKVTGKSPLFMTLIVTGYMSGIIHKVLFSKDYLILLYLFNMVMVITDLCLYTKYNTQKRGFLHPLGRWLHGVTLWQDRQEKEPKVNSLKTRRQHDHAVLEST